MWRLWLWRLWAVSWTWGWGLVWVGSVGSLAVGVWALTSVWWVARRAFAPASVWLISLNTEYPYTQTSCSTLSLGARVLVARVVAAAWYKSGLSATKLESCFRASIFSALRRLCFPVSLGLVFAFITSIRLEKRRK
jgi:hypothetical protein